MSNKLLKEILRTYGFSPIEDCIAREISTGKELNQQIIEQLLDAAKIGDEAYKKFVDERLVKGKFEFLKKNLIIFLGKFPSRS